MLRLPRGRRKPPPPVVDQGAGDGGQSGGQEGQDKKLVPEDVAAVALPVQPPGGDAGVQFRRVRAQGLKEVEDVEVQDQLDLGAAVDIHGEQVQQPAERIPVLRGHPLEVVTGGPEHGQRSQ